MSNRLFSIVLTLKRKFLGKVAHIYIECNAEQKFYLLPYFLQVVQITRRKYYILHLLFLQKSVIKMTLVFIIFTRSYSQGHAL